jgi:FixJ family two-component response regulator
MVRWIRDTMFPMRDQYGRVQRIGGIAQDITVHSPSLVYVVDADQPSRQSLSRLLQRAGYSVKAFASGAEFLEVAPVLMLGCVVLDIRSPQAGGLTSLRQLKANGNRLPVIVTGTSNGDVTVAVQAMKAGAVDWLEMPYEQDALLTAIASGLADIRRDAKESRDVDAARARIAGMSVRERQVLEELLAGGTNKEIGRVLGISPRTVELYRASVMECLGARTLSETVLLAAAAGVRPATRLRKPRPPR